MYLEPMLDEVLTAEERAVVARAKAFAEEHVAPNAARWEWERRYPLETVKAACVAGLNTIELAKKHGGQGLSFSCKLRAFEEIARHDFAFAFALINHHNAVARFARDGQPAHVARLLPRMIAGEVIGCAGLSEPGVGSDFGGLETSAVKVEGGWKLNGAKAWITNAAVAGLSVAYAQTDRTQGYRGIACFAIEADRPGFQRDKPFELHGGHAIGVGGFRLIDYVAPDEAVLHPPGQAFKAALAGINGARTYVAAMCCGMLQASLETAVRYTRQRKTFGQPVLDYQGVRWKLVDAATDLEAARLLTYRASRLIDEGGDAVLPAAYAKKFATEMAVQRIADCIQAMGANGLRAEYPLARHLAGAKIAAYTDGSIEMMNERIGAGLPQVFGLILSTVEMHTGGEPTRIIVDGWPKFESQTLLDKRREAKQRFDYLRRGLMLEPRGHDGMYGALLVEPDHPDADLAVLFMHNEGFSTMCGHATIALARWAVDSGRVARREPDTIVRLQCPCGLVTARVASDGTVRFESVPAFAHALDRIAPSRTWGPVTVDIAYGGAFYAILAADSIGLDLRSSPMRAIADAGEEITKAAAAAIPIEHPDEPDLAFLYGTILTDGGDGANGRPSRNVCIFAGRQIDRSPTGSGVTARLALMAARRRVQSGEQRLFESCTGAIFSGKIVREAPPVGRCKSMIVEVGGRAHQTGEARFRFDDNDPLREGFSLGH